jgi:hypothetical protein
MQVPEEEVEVAYAMPILEGIPHVKFTVKIRCPIVPDILCLVQ